MEYTILVRRVGMRLTRTIDQAAQALTAGVNDHIAPGWEPAGGVSMDVAGTAPFLVLAVVRPR